MQLKRVVLPAPFGPMRPRIIPGSTEKETSELAARPPKNLETCWISRMGAMASGPPRRGGALRSPAQDLLHVSQHPVGHVEDHDDHQDPVDEHVGVGQVLLE